jgi:hypothetical protein
LLILLGSLGQVRGLRAVRRSGENVYVMIICFLRLTSGRRSRSGLLWRVTFYSAKSMKPHTRAAAKDLFKIRDNFQSSDVIYALAETSHLLANARVYLPVFRNQEGSIQCYIAKKLTALFHYLANRIYHRRGIG